MPESIALPADKYVDAIHGTVTHVTARVEIYEQDQTTLWMPSDQLGLVAGEVTVDMGRDERRGLTLTLDNSDNDLNLSPGGLWYDKVIRAYRGVVASDGTTWETQIGEFMVDNLKQKNFPNDIDITCRDFTKKLMLDKFTVTTSFAANQPVEEIIRTIALNGGIPASRLYLPLTGKSTGKIYTFDRMVSRWEAIKRLATDYAFDIYFSKLGILRLEEFTDPYLDPPQYTFQTGEDGNISDFEKSLNDSRLYNHVVVTGGTDDPQNELPPHATATNDDPSSPTSIQELGRRSYFYTSSFMTTEAQCQEVADKFLKVHALEQFDCSIESIVAPYLEAGITVNFIDPEPAVGQPIKYLLSSFNLPLDLGAMSSSVKRVIQVG